MAPQWDELDGSAGPLAFHTAPARRRPSGAGNVVLFHGFPVERDAAQRTGRSFPALADSLASESGRGVIAACLRGVGPSAGDFSLDGWLEDMRTLVEHASIGDEGAGVWLVGFGTGGSLSLCLGAADPRVKGVATFGASATFADWAQDLKGMLEFSKQVGVIRTPGFPEDIELWGQAFVDTRPDESISLLAPRPVLIVHGNEDESVPVADARRLAEIGGPSAELRLLVGAGHRLRADPRAIALLVGWLERYCP